MSELTKSPRRDTHARPRQIVGFSLDPEMAREVKAAAATKGLSLKKLFEEIWRVYKKHGGGRS